MWLFCEFSAFKGILVCAKTRSDTVKLLALIENMVNDFKKRTILYGESTYFGFWVLVLIQ